MIVLWISLAVVLVVAAVAVGVLLVRGGHRGPLDELEEVPPPPDGGLDALATLERPPTLEAPRVEAPEAVIEAEPEVVAPPERPRLRDRLSKTRAALSGYVRGLRGRSRFDEAAWEELEEALLLADVGLDTTTKVLDAVRERAAEEKVTDPDALVDLVESEVASILDIGPREPKFEPGGRNVWLFTGVNGVGKTTTIGKIAAQQKTLGRSVLLVAADTFRAAAAEQLSLWGERIDVEVVRGAEGADPGSVVFDAMASANARGYDLVLVDTAGRLHTKSNLMEELRKLRRIIDRTEGALKEVFLVVDASTGQNGLAQAREFADAVDVTGVALTKLDGTAKGGIVLAIQDQLGIPVKLVGVGEQVDDLIGFEPSEFAAAVFEL